MIKAEGETFNFDDVSKINSNFLETFEFDSVDQYIKTETNEFSAVCPFSGLPDLAKVKIEYFPKGGKCVELKSLKYYFSSFRNVGIYQEAATKRIYDDLKYKLKTNRIRVTSKNSEDSDKPPTALIGEENEVFDKILSYKRLGISEIVLDFITPDKDEILETMSTLSKKVMPEL